MVSCCRLKKMQWNAGGVEYCIHCIIYLNNVKVYSRHADLEITVSKIRAMRSFLLSSRFTIIWGKKSQNQLDIRMCLLSCIKRFLTGWLLWIFSIYFMHWTLACSYDRTFSLSKLASQISLIFFILAKLMIASNQNVANKRVNGWEKVIFEIFYDRKKKKIGHARTRAHAHSKHCVFGMQ